MLTETLREAPASSVVSSRPPGPEGLPILGSLPELRKDPLAFLTGLRERYGDVARFEVLGVPVWLVSHPDHVEALLTDARRFVKGRGLRAGRALLGEGLLTSEGDFWRRQRRLSQPAFHRERLADYGDVMVRYTERTLLSLVDGQVLDVHQLLMGLTLEIVAKTLFDADVASDSSEVGAALEVALREFPRMMNPVRRALSPILPTAGNRRLRAAVGTLDRVIADVIQRRRWSGRDHGDLLSMLLAARDDDGAGMSDRQLRDEVMTLFLAGHETTAIALTWTLYLLAQDPLREARLVAEIGDVLGDRPAGFADLQRLPFADAVVKEAMRLFPPAWAVGRVATCDLELAGHLLRKGTSVVASQWVMHRDPRAWSEPLAFRPERWLPDVGRRVPRFQYFPFGGGPRTCIGASFATLEAVLVLVTMLQRFRVALVPGQTIEPWPSITLRPRNGVRMRVFRR